MTMSQQSQFYHGHQDREDYTPSGAALVAGEIINRNGYAAICTDPEGIDDGALGAVAVSGVFRIKKEVGGGVTFSDGDAVEWDDTAKTAVTATNGDFELGPAIADAGDNDDHVKVRLNKAKVVG